MNLGTQTSSLVNHLYSRATVGQPRPFVGMGATVLGWSDRRACTVTKVTEFGGSKVWGFEIEVVEDQATVVSGSAHDGGAVYEFTRRDGSPSLFRYNKKTQKWVAGFINRDTDRFCAYGSGSGIRIGEREQYIDPSF